MAKMISPAATQAATTGRAFVSVSSPEEATIGDSSLIFPRHYRKRRKTAKSKMNGTIGASRSGTMAFVALVLLSSCSFSSAFQTAPSPLKNNFQQATTASSTRLDSAFTDSVFKRVEPLNRERRRSEYMMDTDENYDYRRYGRRNGDTYSRYGDYNRYGERRRRDRWQPGTYDYYRSNGDSYYNRGSGRDWYDGTSFSRYGRDISRRDGYGGQRWRPQVKDRWYDRVADHIGGPTVQGGTRQTYSKRGYGGDDSQTVLELGSEGRPLYANIETWEGPDNSRSSLNFYSQDGYDYGVRVLSGNRHGSWNDETVSVRNTGPMEYPMQARVDTVRRNEPYASYGGGSSTGTRRASSTHQDRYVRESNGDAFRSYGGSYGSSYNSGYSSGYTSSYSGTPTGPNAKTIQGGGATRHWQLAPSVQSVKVELHSQGLPIMARIELLQGPNNVKTLGEVYQEDGYERPFICVLDTGDSEYQYNKGTIQIINEGPMEFPIIASVEAHEVMAY